MFLELFVIITNLAGIIPILYSYRKKIYFESIVYLCTMIASLVYHTIYSFNTINENNIRNMVKYVDFVLAFCCIHSIVYLIVINNNFHRNIFLFISTFLEMYFNYISLDSIGHLFTTVFIAIFLSLIYNYTINKKKIFSLKKKTINKKCFIFAITLNILEFVFFFIIPHFFESFYHLFHGIHHILGFYSIYFYIKSIKDRFIICNKSVQVDIV